MSDTDLQIALMEAGRMNLMHLPPGAIAWLWDRPKKQIDAAEDLAVSANAHGNPVVDASLLKADQNIMLIKCEGGECFRIYPDGGFSHEDTPMDIGGCSSVLQGMGGGDCQMDDCGHAMDAEPEPMDDGMDDGMDEYALMALPDMDGMGDMMDMSMGEDECDIEPELEHGDRIAKIIQDACDEQDMEEDSSGGLTGAAAGAGMGTGSPYVGDTDMYSDATLGQSLDASDELDNQMMSRELGEFRIKDLPADELDLLAEALGIDYDIK